MLAYAVVGHLVGDYVLQNDWQANNKKGDLLPPVQPAEFAESGGVSATPEERADYRKRLKHWLFGTGVCALHAGLWTASVMAATAPYWCRWWIPVVLFVTHFLQDRTGFIRWWMGKVGQDKFASPPMSPWSIVAVDNVFHILVLYGIARVID